MADKELVLSKVKLYIHHPVPNQLFADIFPIFRDPAVTEAIISHLESHIRSTHDLSKISSIVCLEARGFFFTPILASRLQLPCVPVRKPGKLPGEVITTTYQKDYGPDRFEMKTDAFEGIETAGKKVILVDDLLGMGGSIMAAKELVEQLGMEVAEAVFIFDVDVPVYNVAVEKNLKGLQRYAMVTLTKTNMGAPIEC
ncbi:PRTase-like protein [Hyaloscypha bicolor E]|uniref:adenine phosphoribosyltransferase n=1 Tax=Hyaloscypha bicolor E TaxID=1095630 RepID=A0A2J6T583_9HELO|nr:PRTase-like protein [Hyaloscypha bicolor E]PMD58179.1 PRTase-like protein [Hyaloscypha bicolor E]